jgi:hypothetical protein
MVNNGQARVDLCVEVLCQHGCRKVSGYIEQLKTGEVFQEVAALSVDERKSVLVELESIMQAYDGDCQG